jgi:glycosyltransferase involved in cell wall biosynthesis
MRLTLVIPSMLGGGAQRVLSLLANAWTARGDEITLFALEGNDPSFFALDASVRFRCLGIVQTTGGNKLLALLHRLSSLRRSLRDSKPDVILSFLSRANTLTILSAVGLGVPVFVSERSDPFAWRETPSWRLLRACAYPLATAVVSQTAAVANGLRKNLGDRSVAIPNPVPPAEPARGVRDGTRIVSYGWFRIEKRFDRLVQAFHLICRRHPEWSLTIAGDGPMLPQLKQQIADLELGSRVHLPGIVKNPPDLLKDADIFVLSSEFEGFPNALTEAMAHGVPAIGFDCKSGPSEIVRDGIDGILVPPGDVQALARAMDRMMSDQPLRVAMGKRAVEVSDRFSMSNVLSRWDDLFEKANAPVRRGQQSASDPLHTSGGE